jgi:hypothetical protein
MPWPEVQQIAEKYPWAVVDPSVLIGSKTPTSFEKLADEQNPLWRQYYFDWLETQNSNLTRDQAHADLELLTSYARNRKEKSNVAQKFAEQRRDAARKRLKAAGSLEDFHEVIREIKDAIEKYAKESGEDKSAVGVRFAAEAIASESDDTDSDKVLGEGILQMLYGPLKREYIVNVQDVLLSFREFNKLMDGDWGGLSSVEDALAKAHGNWQSWEGALRQAFGQYDKALDYMMANPAGRLQIRTDDPGHADLYEKVETGDLRKDLWELISRYGQSMLAEWTTVADCFRSVVKWAVDDSKKKMRKNFNAAFKEASAGILAAKTAVGATTTVLAFFPPAGTVAAAGLNLCMTIADIAAKEILIWQASNDADTVISYLGKEFKTPVPETEKEEVIKNILEYGMTALELMEQGTDVIGDATHVGIILSPYISEAAKAAAEASFSTMDSAMPIIGGVLTVASLTHEWYEWSEDQHKELTAKQNLSQKEVDDLQEMLRGAFQSQRSNADWHAGLGEARLLSWTGTEFLVRIKGVEGTISRETYLFSPTDRTESWNATLAQAKKNTTVSYRGLEIKLDLSAPSGITEIKGYLVCKVPGQCQDDPCSGEKFDFVVQIMADGAITITGVDAPTFSEAAAAAAASPNSLITWPPDALTFEVDWASAKLLSTSQWYYECLAPGRVALFPLRKYRDDTIWDLTIKLPWRGTPHVTGSSENQVKPIVQVSTVLAALKESRQDFTPPPERSVAQTYTPDWDTADFADFDRERGGFQIKSVSAYAFNSDRWNSVEDIWVQWDFERERANIDLSNMKETLSISPEKTDELEKIFTSAVTNKKSTKATGKRYKKRARLH